MKLKISKWTKPTLNKWAKYAFAVTTFTQYYLDLWSLTLKTFSEILTHMMKICGKCSWNASTKYRDTASREIVANRQRTDGQRRRRHHKNCWAEKPENTVRKPWSQSGSTSYLSLPVVASKDKVTHIEMSDLWLRRRAIKLVVEQGWRLINGDSYERLNENQIIGTILGTKGRPPHQSFCTDSYALQLCRSPFLHKDTL